MDPIAPHPVGRSWQRIENWLHGIGRDRELAAPADRAGIARAEAEIGAGLHPDHTELLLGHDGSGGFLLPPRFYVLGVDEVLSHWRLKVRIWAPHYAPHWIPFAADGAGGVLYVDASHPHERLGHHDKEGPMELTDHPMWDSIRSLLHHTADALETGAHLDGYRRPGPDSRFLLWEYWTN